MKLWRIYQDVNDGYDTFDAAIVAAETAEEARDIHPMGGGYTFHDGHWLLHGKKDPCHGWAPPENVGVVLIGEAAPNVPAGVVLASFNAG